MKILFLAEPDSANTQAWADGLRALGCEVRIASVRVARGTADGQVVPLGPRGLPPRLRLLLATADLRRVIAEFRPDLLLAYRVTSYGYLAARSGFRPLVVAAQNEQIVYQPRPTWWRTRLLTRFAQFAIAHADLLHAWSPAVAAGLRRFGLRDDQIMIMHRGINTRLFSPPPQPPLRQSNPVLISTRALYPEYLLDELLRAFAVLRQRLPGARLVVAGDGPEDRSLRVLAEELGISSTVEFAGRLSPEQVAERLRDADLYVSLIRTEGVSSSLLEACACGVYPVVADIPASHHFPGAAHGLLLAEMTPADMAARLAEIIADPAARAAAIQHNRREVRQGFDRQSNLRQFVTRYEAVISHSQTRQSPQN